MPAPEEIREKIQLYTDNRSQYRTAGFKEAELRQQFLDPLFSALGWDVGNKYGHAEQYKEVVIEQSMDVEGDTRAPDYAFRIGGVTKFFVEAKKPAVDITTDWKPAFQLKRYAWSAKLPLSILTNFEDFSVYDCRFKPDKHDDPTKGRILYMSFDELEERWDELTAIFTKDAILKGSFDKYAQEKKRGTSEVDSEILKDIESWREELAKNIALRNPELTIEQMNFSVQRLIDRILFLRICEDRGTEPENQLLGIYENKTDIYRHLVDVFQLADAKYNSGLFHFTHNKKRSTKVDRLTPGIMVDDRVLASIIWDLYYPNSPYQFDVIPADILGQVYEQFLGKVIRLTAGHQAKVEEKPEVKKAGGVYYTPTYIVDYIVENTVVKLCQGKTPEKMKKLKILDPACGSGSFLIVAYKKLMDKHLEWYIANNPKKYKDEIFQNHKGAWQLTLQEKKKILLASIHGVDIDNQAVEVTKLNLLLKALEGESRESISNVNKWFREPALPDLENNIKCGNSLIGHDISELLQELSEEERKAEMARINPFDWGVDFSEIMTAGGFDAVVGNPPYGASFSDCEKFYFQTNYETTKGRYESFRYFIEKGVSLIGQKGRFGYIVPDTWFTLRDAEPLRRFLLTKSNLEQLVCLHENVFDKVKVDVCIFITSKDERNLQTRVKIASKNHTKNEFVANNFITEFQVNPNVWLSLDECKIDVHLSPERHKIVTKMHSVSISLSELAISTTGPKPYQVGKGNPPQTKKTLEIKPFTSISKLNDSFRVMLRGSDIDRYSYPEKNDEWLSYGEWLAEIRNPLLFTQPRLLIQSIRNPKLKRRIIATYLDNDSVNNNSITNVIMIGNLKYKIHYILGILNSELINWLFTVSYNIVNIDPRYLKIVPIRTIDFSNKEDVARHDKMVRLVERMLKLHRDLKEAGTPEKEERVEREIRATDKEIDGLVYELYGLSQEEIGVVEGN